MLAVAALEQTSVTMEVMAQLIATTPQGGRDDREDRDEPGQTYFMGPFIYN